jgi:hypothetical protein
MAHKRRSERRAKRSATAAGLEGLSQEIAQLPALDIPARRQRWTALMNDDPSPIWGGALLMRALAYRLQERSAAGLKPSTQRLLDRVAENRAKDAARDKPNSRVTAGTVLIREWMIDHIPYPRFKRFNAKSKLSTANACPG